MDKPTLPRNSFSSSEFFGSTVHLIRISVSKIGTTKAIGVWSDGPLRSWASLGRKHPSGSGMVIHHHVVK
jgi:hypothetical protein